MSGQKDTADETLSPADQISGAYAVAPRKVGRPSKYDPSFCDAVIASGAEGKTLAEMANDLGINRATLKDWQEAHPEFSSAVKTGLDKAQAWWEGNGRLATFGAMPGYNATSYIFQMKNRFKDDWRDKVETEHSGETTHNHRQIELIGVMPK
jgi:hypothetical protein